MGISINHTYLQKGIEVRAFPERYNSSKGNHHFSSCALDADLQVYFALKKNYPLDEEINCGYNFISKPNSYNQKGNIPTKKSDCY
jgi:hypothetical protein